jgi:hypothetical protein
MDKPLSFSAYRDYHVCPQYYKLKRIDKQPAGRDTSALAVGTILDAAVEALLLDKPYDIEAAITEASQRDLEFYMDDFDVDLIDITSAKEYATLLGWKGDNLEGAIKSFLKNQATLTKGQQKLLNAVVWDSLKTKIYAMYNSFVKWIYPQIAQVHETQTHMDNGVIHGYLDFTATLKDGRKVLFDLKTSKAPYALDAVRYSPQLCLYAAMHEYDHVGYIVLSKTLRKNKVKTCECGYSVTGGNRRKCPECGEKLSFTVEPTSYSQILVEPVPKWSKDLTTKAMSDTIKAIDGKHFPHNLTACKWMFGKPCPFINKCWKAE